MPSNGRDEVERLCELVRAAHPGLEEAVKWGRPTFAAGADWHHWICAVAAGRRGVRLVFHKGALLPDPADLLGGENRYTREIPVARALADPDAVAALVRAAVERREAKREDGR